MALLAWVFTPIFQTIFIGLAFLYSVTGDIGIAIILLTIVIRILLIPVFRKQIVSQRRMQMLQPELRAIQTKYKGDRQKISEEQMKLYRDRGVNPASGCLPAVLQMLLLLPMYQVFMQGLNAPDISSMLHPFGIQLVNVQCQDPGNPYVPCIDPNIPWLAWLPKIDDGLIFPGYPGGLPSNQPEIFLMLLSGFGFGLSLLALTSAGLQLIQSRMMMNRDVAPGDTHGCHHQPHDADPAAVLAHLWRDPAGRPVHLLDHHDRLQHRPAVPDQRLRRALPALRLDPGHRQGLPGALPGEHAGAETCRA